MGLMDTVGDVAGAAGDLLGGDESAQASKPEATPKFLEGEKLNGEGENDGGAVAPQNLNPFNKPAPTEFIHFGHVHPDIGTNFQHEERSDIDGAEIPEKKALHGVMFRSALLRETLCLLGQIAAVKQTLVDYQSSKGALGEVADAASSAMSAFGAGSGDSGPKPPDPAALDQLTPDITQAAGYANKKELKYPELRQTGYDLHKARAGYRKFVEDVNAYYLVPGGPKQEGGALGDALGSVGSAVGGALGSVGGPMETVTGFMFKAQDLAMGMFLAAREAYEPVVDEECWKLSIRAITEKHVPIYPVWYPPPPPPPEEAKEEEDFFDGPTGGPLGGVTDTVNDTAKDVKDTAADVEKTVDDAKEDFRQFWEPDNKGEPTFGDPALEAIFAQLAGAGPVYCGSIKTILGLSSDLPKFVSTIVEEITLACHEMLHDTYTRVMRSGGRGPIPKDMLLKAGRRHLYDRLIRVASGFVPMLSRLQSGDQLAGLDGIGGVSGQDLSNKGFALLDGATANALNNIVDVSVSILGDQLEEARASAARINAGTMEPLVARAPYFLTLMVRNTMFPVWELVMDLVFGNINKYLGMATSPTKAFLGDVGDKARDVKGGVDDANKKKDQAEQALKDASDFAKDMKNEDFLYAGQKLSDPEALMDEVFGDDPTGPEGPEEEKPAPFPGENPRETAAEGAKVDKAQYDEVVNEQAALEYEPTEE